MKPVVGVATALVLTLCAYVTQAAEWFSFASNGDAQVGSPWYDHAPLFLADAARAVPGVKSSAVYVNWLPLTVHINGQLSSLGSLTVSLEALARQINPALNVDELAEYLLRTNTVARVGERYELRQPWVMLRGIPGSAHDRSMRALLGALRTFEHNLLAPSDTPSWFEFMAETPHFPVSKLSTFDKLLRRLGLALLRRLDAFMRDCEVHRDPKEPTVWLGVSTYRFQHDAASVFTSSAAHAPAIKPGSPSDGSL